MYPCYLPGDGICIPPTYDRYLQFGIGSVPNEHLNVLLPNLPRVLVPPGDESRFLRSIIHEHYRVMLQLTLDLGRPLEPVLRSGVSRT